MGKVTHYQGQDGKTYCGVKGSHHFSWAWQNVDCKRCKARQKSGKNP